MQVSIAAKVFRDENVRYETNMLNRPRNEALLLEMPLVFWIETLLRKSKSEQLRLGLEVITKITCVFRRD